MAGGHHTLDARKFEQTLEILRHEQKVLRPSPRQDLAFQLLRIGTYCAGAIVAAMVAVALVDWLTPGKDLADIFTGRSLLILFALGLLLLPISSAIAILFFFNVPLIFKFLRHRKLIYDLGLTTALHEPWRAQRRSKRTTITLATFAVGLGLLILGFLATVAREIFTGDLDLEEVAMFFFALVVGVALVATYFMQRRRDRMEAVDQLLASLEETRSEAMEDTIDIPASAYRQIARIERQQIDHARKESILDFEQAEPAFYSVTKSAQTREAQAALPLRDKQLVQDQIDSLAEAPFPEASREESRGVRALEVAGTAQGVRIDYVVDEETRRLQIVSLTSQPAGEDPRGDEEHGERA